MIPCRRHKKKQHGGRLYHCCHFQPENWIYVAENGNQAHSDSMIVKCNRLAAKRDILIYIYTVFSWFTRLFAKRHCLFAITSYPLEKVKTASGRAIIQNSTCNTIWAPTLAFSINRTTEQNKYCAFTIVWHRLHKLIKAMNRYFFNHVDLDVDNRSQVKKLRRNYFVSQIGNNGPWALRFVYTGIDCSTAHSAQGTREAVTT